ncbi:hypothetical protein GCM10008090_25450 [Arenicella chitinivorans]|uniref:Beta-ketoacyl synthase-like N-terminal domain-containing protein n=1 Tax=Arenicella chitinivorans TaxID=1329800 RepID=A0A918RZC4_9GAMM|nr:beta-ketoacyl synthase chain length factor [Arenicella chitinivorans]GHA14558.1 hypothetical protein GCM10008090_25450 [Arenicella chitinivorans]
MSEFNFSVLGIGAWGLTARSWPELQELMAGKPIEDDGSKGPKPALIPANERRRAPLPVRLAVETSAQACAAAKLDPAEVGCVFVSGLGDTALTDYMCTVLASDNKALSPTKFHNSVHNAAAGYWTISTGCTEAANSVAGFDESVSLTLVEALIQAEEEQRPLLMTFYDAPVSAVLQPLLKNPYPFSVSLVIAPESLSPAGSPVWSASVMTEAATWPSANWPGELQDCYQSNPVARVLCILDMLTGGLDSVTMPLSSATAVTVTRVS